MLHVFLYFWALEMKSKVVQENTLP